MTDMGYLMRVCNKMSKHLLKFPFAIDHIQTIKMPKGAKIIDIEAVNDDFLIEGRTQLYLIAIAEQDLSKYMSRKNFNKSIESRKFITYGVGSLMEETGDKLKLVGRYSLTFRRFEDFPITKSFYVFERIKD